MTAITAEQVAGMVDLMGPPSGTTVAEWVAKARQESSFDKDVENGDHVGLYQIDYHLHAGKGLLTSFDPEKARQQLKSPTKNYEVAKWLYQHEGGWKPWNASGGKPKPTAEDKAAAADPDSILQGVPDIVDKLDAPFATIQDALGAIVNIAVDAGKWLSDRHNWGRIAFVAVGGLVMIAAVGAVIGEKAVDISSEVHGGTPS